MCLFIRCLSIKPLQKFKVHFKFEVDKRIFEDVKEENSHEYQYKPNPEATVANIIIYARHLEALFAPIYESLSTIVFVVNNEMKLFEKYISLWNVSQFRDDTMVQYSTKLKMKKLNVAVKNAAKRVYEILSGTATIDDLHVKCREDLKLNLEANDMALKSKQKFKEIDFVHEKASLEKYSELYYFKEFEVNISAVYNNTVQLFQIVDHLISLRKACEQFKLELVLADSSMVQLQNIEEDMLFAERRSRFTVCNVSSEVAHLKTHLCIQDDDISSHPCFQLVAAIKESNSFYKLAKERGFDQPNGSRLFREQYQIVVDNLVSDSNRDFVTDHLLGSFKFFEPFLHQEYLLIDLMSKITSLDHIDKAIEQIKTVNKYALLIRFLFDSAEVSIDQILIN